MKMTVWIMGLTFLLLISGAATAMGGESPMVACPMEHSSHAVMPDAEKAFAEVQALILENYVEPEVAEDEVWTGAVEGMLDQLVQHPEKKINTLLSPEELTRLNEGLKNEFAGVGVVIKQAEGVVFVVNVVPGGAAVGAGIQAGDRILAVDGTSMNGMSLERLVGMIRGPVDSRITLGMQRDRDEWDVTLTRAPVRVEPVMGQLLDQGVAYVRIVSFTDNTLEAMDDLLEALKHKGSVSRLVLDLRDCPGGLFDMSVAVAGRFLPKGAVIVSTRDRNGKEVVYKSEKGEKVTMPMVVLVNRGSASGSELVAAALSDNDRAMAVGGTTFGKGTVESIHELSNGWAVKLSVAYFYSPGGENWQGKGIVPDFSAATEPDWKLPSAYEPVDLAADAQLQTAINVLKLQH